MIEVAGDFIGGGVVVWRAGAPVQSDHIARSATGDFCVDTRVVLISSASQLAEKSSQVYRTITVMVIGASFGKGSGKRSFQWRDKGLCG